MKNSRGSIVDILSAIITFLWVLPEIWGVCGLVLSWCTFCGTKKYGPLRITL